MISMLKSSKFCLSHNHRDTAIKMRANIFGLLYDHDVILYDDVITLCLESLAHALFINMK